MKLIGMIADHPTPKNSRGGTAFTLNSRDYKGVLVVIYEGGENAKDGNSSTQINSKRV